MTLKNKLDVVFLYKTLEEGGFINILLEDMLEGWNFLYLDVLRDQGVLRQGGIVGLWNMLVVGLLSQEERWHFFPRILEKAFYS